MKQDRPDKAAAVIGKVESSPRGEHEDKSGDQPDHVQQVTRHD